MNSRVAERPRVPPCHLPNPLPSALASSLPHPLPNPLPNECPQRVATDIVAVYQRIAPLADKVQWVHRETACRAGDISDSPVHRAGRIIAAAIDAEAPHFDRHPYHNRQHFCEVMLASSCLARLHGLGPDEVELLLLAALIHDFVHDGRPARAFRLERRSVERAAALFDPGGGMESQQLGRLAALVLATEPVDGVRLALAAGRFHADGTPMPKIPECAPELGQLAADRRLSRLALLLCEADLLPSVGLTFEHGMRLQDRLAEEWGRPLTFRDKLGFVDNVLACGVIGDFFRPNTVTVRRELRRQVDEAAEPDGR